MRAAAILVVLVVLAACAFVPRTSGTELCLACGAERTRSSWGPIATHADAPKSGGTAWYERARGACRKHAWQRVGCRESKTVLGTTVSCTELPEHHAFDERLASMNDDAAAIELSKTFDALSSATKLRVLELFEGAEFMRREHGADVDAVIARRLRELGCAELAGAVPVGVEPGER